MAKRIAFAWIEKQIDFDNYEEAVDYWINNRHKNWMFKKQSDEYMGYLYSFEENYEQKLRERAGHYIIHTPQRGNSLYAFGGKDVKEYWTIEVKVPYGKYNGGW